MKVLPPIVVTDAMIISTSVFETAPNLYNAGATYALGEYRAVAGLLGVILIYKSLQNGNLAHTPASSPTWWEYNSSTYDFYSISSLYSKGYRVIDPASHKVYESVIDGNMNRSLTGLNEWIGNGKNILPLPAVWNIGTAYAAGDLVRYEITGAERPLFVFGIVEIGVYKSLVGSNAGYPPQVVDGHWEFVPAYPVPYFLTANYPQGRVAYDAAGNSYQSTVTPNVGTPLVASTPAWVEVGVSNKFAPFDPQSSTQAIANKSITYTVATGLIEAVALVNCLGDFATVTVRDGLGGPIVYENTNGIAGDTVSDWYQYLFSDPTIQRKQVIFTNIPPYTNSHVTITVTSASTVAIGDALFGRWKDVGLTNFGLQAGITDFSVVTEDGFGGTKFVKRGNKKYMDSRNWIKNEGFNRAFNLLSQLPATPCFWLAGDVPDFSEALGLKAYYKDFSVDIAGPQEAYCTLKLIGLI